MYNVVRLVAAFLLLYINSVHSQDARCNLALTLPTGTNNYKRWTFRPAANGNPAVCALVTFSGTVAEAQATNAFCSQSECECKCITASASCTVTCADGSGGTTGGGGTGGGGTNAAFPPECLLDVVQGTACASSDTRWFYNRKTRSCESFTFRGCNPGGNNFFTKEACETRCFSLVPEASKACLEPFDAGDKSCSKYSRYEWFFDKVAGICKPFLYNGCGKPKNKFSTYKDCMDHCEIFYDSTAGQSADCRETERDSGDFCDDDENQQTFLDRYYYNSAKKRCFKFIYFGCKGSNNRFEELSDCQQKCEPFDAHNCPEVPGYIIDLCANNPLVFGPRRDDRGCNIVNPLLNPCQTVNPCAKFIGCKSNELCIPEQPRLCLNPPCEWVARCEDPLDACTYDYDYGKQCDFGVRRFVYNRLLRTCEEVPFGGCGGNANNFISYQACMFVCAGYGPGGGGTCDGRCPYGCVNPRPIIINGCSLCQCDNLPPPTRPCPCQPPYYCNANNNQCQLGGGGCPQGCQAPYVCVNNQCQLGPSNQCQLPLLPGTPCGYPQVTRYYYDQVTRQCQPFQWYGCQSNGNNFQTIQECNNRCNSNCQSCSSGYQCPAGYQPVTGANGCCQCQQIQPPCQYPPCPACTSGVSRVDANNCCYCDNTQPPCQYPPCPACTSGVSRVDANNCCYCDNTQPPCQYPPCPACTSGVSRIDANNCCYCDYNPQPPQTKCYPCEQVCQGRGGYQIGTDLNGCALCQCNQITPYGCQPCTVSCQYGYLSDVDLQGCPSCVCATSPGNIIQYQLNECPECTNECPVGESHRGGQDCSSSCDCV